MKPWVIRFIASANKQQIIWILEEAVKRYRELYPEWEILTFSIERSADRDEQLDLAIRMLDSIKRIEK